MKNNGFKTEFSSEMGGIVGTERIIKTLAPLVAQTDIGEVVVPKGFESDGASIPRFAWSIVGHPFSGYLPAAVVHDYLYRQGSEPDCSRREADKVLADLMRCLGYSWVKSKTFYLSVRAGGWRSWKKREI